MPIASMHSQLGLMMSLGSAHGLRARPAFETLNLLAKPLQRILGPGRRRDDADYFTLCVHPGRPSASEPDGRAEVLLRVFLKRLGELSYRGRRRIGDFAVEQLDEVTALRLRPLVGRLRADDPARNTAHRDASCFDLAAELFDDVGGHSAESCPPSVAGGSVPA